MLRCQFLQCTYEEFDDFASARRKKVKWTGTFIAFQV